MAIGFLVESCIEFHVSLLYLVSVCHGSYEMSYLSFFEFTAISLDTVPKLLVGLSESIVILNCGSSIDIADALSIESGLVSSSIHSPFYRLVIAS